MKKVVPLMSLIVLLGMTASLTFAQNQQGNLKRGKEIFLEHCSRCHGVIE